MPFSLPYINCGLRDEERDDERGNDNQEKGADCQVSHGSYLAIHYTTQEAV
ncbi:MAG TPA: hypothetical protein VM537_33615 [Anaerolineae bacterium]|nr:hypothetical protein [Anaerolineae bacterium]